MQSLTEKRRTRKKKIRSLIGKRRTRKKMHFGSNKRQFFQNIQQIQRPITIEKLYKILIVTAGVQVIEENNFYFGEFFNTTFPTEYEDKEEADVKVKNMLTYIEDTYMKNNDYHVIKDIIHQDMIGLKYLIDAATGDETIYSTYIKLDGITDYDGLYNAIKNTNEDSKSKIKFIVDTYYNDKNLKNIEDYYKTNSMYYFYGNSPVPIFENICSIFNTIDETNDQHIIYY